MPKIELVEQCPACKGSGVYVGFAECDGYAVVCGKCKGAGKYHFTHEYEEFTGLKIRDDVTNVIKCNPGIGVGKRQGYDFGGISYAAWLENDGVFPPNTEMRQFTCPAWWYQHAEYQLMPDWVECTLGRFPSCHQFPNKEDCWARWDKEFTQN